MTDVGVHLGCAGWGLSSEQATQFGPGASVLQRYATRFPAVEINSSFSRPHRRSTYERWAASVPDTFRFSVKVPRAITHEARLREVQALMAPFLEQAGGLGDKLGCLLVQLPPSLAFDDALASNFFQDLRARTAVPVACEPRHASWFGPDAQALLITHRVGRVAADPARFPGAAAPGGWRQTVYYRWHGSPRMYSSSYPHAALTGLAQHLRQTSAAESPWVIFDNTAAGAAVENALTLMTALTAPDTPEQRAR
ncbi:DUF72 domain-containing protein (plasmid) [Deinococcus taeanensis]|uniref:DUF72 domain-containing protein n=1 Tax=Deinococcus taeanensis TaxID=2737050 RepID=UPI001CDBB4E0|nr:DUF72 domain-containing protein [Deinococcus taeanensis]UBV45111.1 DUF72 domain-containing protein [Deinococcus taeanensis]